MDYYFVIVSAIAGGISGAIVSFFGFKKISTTVLGVVLFSTIIGIGKTPAVKTTIMSYFDEHYAIKQEIMEKMSAFRDIPEVAKKLKSFKNVKDAQLYSRVLVHKGIKRLSFDELMVWNETRLEMAKLSKQVCVGLWNGNLTDEVLLNSMAKLDKLYFNNWVEFSIKAAKLEVKAAAYLHTTRDDFNQGVVAIANLYGELAKTKIGAAFAAGPQISDDDACWAMKTLLSGATKIDKKVSEKFLRQMSMM
ncbi:MAG: hypothetical protein ISR65_17015 [Bacteriovoracaceae bacterium]|nr:hypothetical protein [Bacteriovoracaceae bacterium]